MVWSQTEPGVWTDEYDGAEKVFFNMSQAFKGFGREHGSVYVVCQLKLTDQHTNHSGTFETGLQEAWKRLRFEYPALAVFEKNGKKTYLESTHDDLDIEKWVRDTFWVDDTAVSASDFLPDLHLRKLPCLLFILRSSEILFHSSHWRIDALGTCMVIDRFLDLTSKFLTTEMTLEPPEWNLECQNLSPSLEDAYGSPTTSTQVTSAKAEEIRKRNFDTAYPSVGLPFRGGSTAVPGLSQTHALEFTTKNTVSVISACKARGISVTAAVHAACASVVFSRSADKDCDTYSTVVSANLRKLLPSQAHHCVCGTYVTGITHTLKRTDDFATQSHQLTLGYRQHCSPGEEATAYMRALRSIYMVHGQTMADMAGKRVMSNVTVSSLGVVDGPYLRGDHGAVQVERFRLGSAIMTRQPTLYIWTFGGRLTLSVDYNEAYYNAEDVTGLLDSIGLCLIKELNID